MHACKHKLVNTNQVETAALGQWIIGRFITKWIWIITKPKINFRLHIRKPCGNPSEKKEDADHILAITSLN